METVGVATKRYEGALYLNVCLYEVTGGILCRRTHTHKGASKAGDN